MNLFDEKVNKYYEFLTLELSSCGKEGVLREDVIERAKKYTYKGGDIFRYADNKELERLFPSEIVSDDISTNELIFSAKLTVKEQGALLKAPVRVKEYVPRFQEPMPVRNTRIELEAVKNMSEMEMANILMSPSTLQKLKSVLEDIESEWGMEDICIRGQFDQAALTENDISNLTVIRNAIKDKCAISCVNRTLLEIEHKSDKIYPVKLEYSVLNDMFRICAYDSDKECFVKMNLPQMSDVKLVGKPLESLTERYQIFLEQKMKSVTLDVEPTDYIVERCFRVFSCYNRECMYDEKNNKYTLKINYLDFDKKELMKEILSFGSHVTVMEPADFREEIFARIKKAYEVAK